MDTSRKFSKGIAEVTSVTLKSDDADGISHSTDTTIVERLYFEYPMRLLKPNLYIQPFQALYLLTFGGGLVHSDRIEFKIALRNTAKIVLLTPGASKAYKRKSYETSNRDDKRLNHDVSRTMESCLKLNVNICKRGFFCYWPGYTIPYRDCEMRNEVHFNLEFSDINGISQRPSLFYLDWLVSGRSYENYDVHKLTQLCTVHINSKLYFRDSFVLEQHGNLMGGDFKVFGTVLLVGPEVESLVQRVLQNSGDFLSKNSGFSNNALKFSVSPLQYPALDNDPNTIGCFVRLTTKNIEDMKHVFQTCFIDMLEVPSNLFKRPY
jgi:urease accessory protein UreH